MATFGAGTFLVLLLLCVLLLLQHHHASAHPPRERIQKLDCFDLIIYGRFHRPLMRVTIGDKSRLKGMPDWERQEYVLWIQQGRSVVRGRTMTHSEEVMFTVRSVSAPLTLALQLHRENSPTQIICSVSFIPKTYMGVQGDIIEENNNSRKAALELN